MNSRGVYHFTRSITGSIRSLVEYSQKQQQIRRPLRLQLCTVIKSVFNSILNCPASMTILSIQLLALHCPPIKFDYYTVDFVPALAAFWSMESREPVFFLILHLTWQRNLFILFLVREKNYYVAVGSESYATRLLRFYSAVVCFLLVT